MATTNAITPPPFTAEPYSPTAVSPSPEELQDIKPISDRPSAASPPEQLETSPPPFPTLPPLFIQSISELKGLYSAIESFQQCYEDLHKHLDSIKAAISSKLPPENQHIPATAQSPSSSPRLDESETPPEPEASLRPDESEGTLLHNQQSEQSELESLCKTMCSRGIRKYLSTHLSNLPKVREEVPKALKLAPNPPKLVLESLGKFYLQGSKAFSRNSPMIPAREASIMILECFLLMMGVDNGVLSIEKVVKTEADKAALAWRKRMLTEGGVSKANQIDARGLLFFVACFGIPDSFKRDDIRDLVVAVANDKEIVGVLRKSHLLMNTIPEMVEGMMKNRMEVDAVNLVYTFGLEERFNPQTILVSYLRESKEYWKKTKKGQQGSVASMTEANKKQLSAMRSIRRCLERHKVDPAKLLPGWQINERITTLENEIGDAEKKLGEKSAQKRKANETDTSRKPKPHDPKRSRYMGHNPQQHKAGVHADLNRRSLLDSGGLTNHHHHPNNYHSSTPILYGGPGAGLLPESMIPSGIGPGISSGHVQYAGTHGGGVMVDSSGQVINHGAHPYSWHRDPVMNDRYASGQPSVGLTSLYRGSASVEGYGGVGNVSSVGGGAGNRGSDLYQFADSVVQTESYQGGGGVPQSVSSVQTDVTNHYSSYLYQV